jgi:hypothetical protein
VKGLNAISSPDEFCRRWDGIHNFLLDREFLTFHFSLPPLDRILSELLQDEDSVIVNAGLDPFLHIPRQDVREKLLLLPIHEVMEQSFSLCHYDLHRFDAPGGLLEGLEAHLLNPWRAFLEGEGFTLTEYYKPYFFISGPHGVAEYHMDFSHVLACQVYGTKRFCSFAEPEKWADSTTRRQMLTEGHNAYTQPIPGDFQAKDTTGCTMVAGDRLWNTLQTPHWVLGGDEMSLSLNIAHRGLRYRGRLCRHEQELECWKTEWSDEGNS